MGKRVDRERDAEEVESFIHIGRAWERVSRKVLDAHPTTQIVVRSFTVRHTYATDSPYQARLFIILRARIGARDLVKFRRLSALRNLSHVLEDMLRSESDWRDDKYGSDGNL